MFAQHRRRLRNRLAHVRHLDRIAGQPHLADLRMIVFDDHLALLDRRLGKSGVEIVDRRRRHVGCAQPCEPVGRGAGAEDFLQTRHHHFAVLHARRVIGIERIVGELGMLEHDAKLLPETFLPRRHHDVAVATSRRPARAPNSRAPSRAASAPRRSTATWCPCRSADGAWCRTSKSRFGGPCRCARGRTARRGCPCSNRSRR